MRVHEWQLFGIETREAECPKVADTSCSRVTEVDPNRPVRLSESSRSTRRRSPDHLVGAEQDRLWNGQSEILGGSQVNHEFEFCRLLDRQVERSFDRNSQTSFRHPPSETFRESLRSTVFSPVDRA
jgi:hypothetical protein